MNEVYNLEWWRMEQEANCKFHHLTKTRPWYKCTTRQQLAKDPETGLYYNDHGNSDMMKEYIISHYQSLGYNFRIRSATRAGFLSSAMYAVMPYMGQWGRGWIIATGLSASSVNYCYILIE